MNSRARSNTAAENGRGHGLGREQVDWGSDVWEALDAAVHDEFHRSAVGLKFIPFHGQIDNAAMTVPADVVDLDTMTVDESTVISARRASASSSDCATTNRVEAQNLMGIALAARRQPPRKPKTCALLRRGGARNRSSSAATQRRCWSWIAVRDQAVSVKPVSDKPKRYAEHTFDAVVEGYSLLQQQGHERAVRSRSAARCTPDTFASLPPAPSCPRTASCRWCRSGCSEPGCCRPRPACWCRWAATRWTSSSASSRRWSSATQHRGVYRFRAFERFALRVRGHVRHRPVRLPMNVA